MDPIKTGRLISEARAEKGLSQQKLAEELHITRTTVSKWENGRGMPDISILEGLSSALGLSVAELIHGERETGEAQAETIHEVISLSNRSRRRSRTLILVLAALSIVLAVLVVAIAFPGERFIDCPSLARAEEIAGFGLDYGRYYSNNFPSGVAVSRSIRAKKGVILVTWTYGTDDSRTVISFTKGLGDAGISAGTRGLTTVRHEDSHNLPDGSGGWSYVVEDLDFYGHSSADISMITWRAGDYSYTWSADRVRQGCYPDNMYEEQGTGRGIDWYGLYMMISQFK